MNLLVTGGLGYIGSHVVIELVKKGFRVDILDNLSNSHITTLEKLREFTNSDIQFHNVDLRDLSKVKDVFSLKQFDAVIHFAGLKAVGESVLEPQIYYENNVLGTINLINAMQANNCKKIVFSSSATVYGDPEVLPLNELSKVQTVNPYGENKLIIEKYLNYLSKADGNWCVGILRYFNPVGAHKSYLFGENPLNTPNNLMPIICRVAEGKIKELKIFGKDYKTNDGTGVRDYIHVIDLAIGHIAALEYLFNKSQSFTVNLGTGKGYSVLEMVEKFEQVNNVEVPFVFAPRRNGDVDKCFADVDLSKKLLGWKSIYTLDDMCKDSWESYKKL
jgi:UDP-glucose 4-epimerase